jgi:ubiquitin
MLIYVLQWQPSWISDRHKKLKFCRGPSNDADPKSKMATTTGHRLTLDPMGKCSNAFFSETTNMVKAIYVLQWQPSWISDRHKKLKFCRGPSNDHSWAVWFHLSKWFQRGSVLRHFVHRVQC